MEKNILNTRFFISSAAVHEYLIKFIIMHTLNEEIVSIVWIDVAVNNNYELRNNFVAWKSWLFPRMFLSYWGRHFQYQKPFFCLCVTMEKKYTQNRKEKCDMYHNYIEKTKKNILNRISYFSRSHILSFSLLLMNRGKFVQWTFSSWAFLTLWQNLNLSFKV